MSPLISLLEKEAKPDSTRHEHADHQHIIEARGCGTGRCACIKPCTACTCRDKKER